jgi:hypothetical protein
MAILSIGVWPRAQVIDISELGKVWPFIRVLKQHDRTVSRGAVDEEALFRRRLQQLVLEKYGSLDRFLPGDRIFEGPSVANSSGQAQSLAGDHDQTGEDAER